MKHFGHRSVSRQQGNSLIFLTETESVKSEALAPNDKYISYLRKIPGFNMTNIQFPAERNLDFELSKSKHEMYRLQWSVLREATVRCTYVSL